MRVAIACVVVFLLVSGCGGKQSGSSSTPVGSSPAPSSCGGEINPQDSLVEVARAGYRMSKECGASEEDLLKKIASLP